jgi:hypothetical protein
LAARSRVERRSLGARRLLTINVRGQKMDLRFNYEHIRQQIDSADFDPLDNDSLIVKDIKQRMHSHIDAIEELEEEKKEINTQINLRRLMLKDLADSWEI